MLTTRCPHCHTLFRIRPDQLSQRGGRVRCGSCQQAFSALANLEDSELTETPEQPKPVAQVPKAAPPTQAPTEPVRVQQAVVPPQPTPQPAFNPAAMPAPMHAPETRTPASPWDNFGLNADAHTNSHHDDAWANVSHFSPDFVIDENMGNLAAESVSPPSPPKPAVPPSAPKPSPVTAAPSIAPFSATPPIPPEPKHESADERREPTLDLSDDTPDFDIDINEPEDEEEDGRSGLPTESPFDEVSIAEMENVAVSVADEHKGKRRRSLDEDEESAETSPTGHTGSVVMWSLGMLVMLVACVAMLSYIFRTEISRNVPALRPILESACSHAGCTVPYPQDAELIYLESHNFTPEAGQDGQFRLVVTLMNKAAYSQSWPHLELTVTDRFDIAVARRVLKPSEWLPQTSASQPAFEGHSEVTANLLLNLSKTQAAGYRLYVFYP